MFKLCKNNANYQCVALLSTVQNDPVINVLAWDKSYHVLQWSSSVFGHLEILSS